MTDPKTEWRDEEGRYLIALPGFLLKYDFDFQAEDGARKALTRADALFLLRYLSEALDIESAQLDADIVKAAEAWARETGRQDLLDAVQYAVDEKHRILRKQTK